MLLFSFRRYCQKVSQNVVLIYAYLGWNLVISVSFILDILKGLFIAIPKFYNWHFSDYQWNSPPFYSILSIFYIFFWKVSTWDLRPFFLLFCSIVSNLHDSALYSWMSLDWLHHLKNYLNEVSVDVLNAFVKRVKSMT